VGATTDIIAGMLGLLDDYIAANPTLLRRRFNVRPPTLVTDLPCAYIDYATQATETIHFDAAMRDRTPSPSIVFVDRLTDNSEVETRFYTLIDSFTEFLNTNTNVYVKLALTNGTRINGVWSDATWSQFLEQLGGDPPAPAVAFRLTFNDVLFKESRL
jgi:hypothetical protein